MVTADTGLGGMSGHSAAALHCPGGMGLEDIAQRAEWGQG